MNVDPYNAERIASRAVELMRAGHWPEEAIKRTVREEENRG